MRRGGCRWGVVKDPTCIESSPFFLVQRPHKVLYKRNISQEMNFLFFIKKYFEIFPFFLSVNIDSHT